MNLFPPVIRVDTKISGTANARHNLFGVRIWMGAEHFEAILAQERYEWRFLRVRGVLAMLPVIATAMLLVREWTFAATLLTIVLAIIAHVLVKFWPGLTREMELRGHMIEVLVAVRDYGADRATKLNYEARTLERYSQFKGWTVAKIEAEMLRREDIAAGWIE